MSDSPPISTDAIGEESGWEGWREPTTPGTWREPEREPEAGWRVPTLPPDLQEEPEETGAWHLPRPEDTIFSPEDEIEIRPPEDATPDAAVDGAVQEVVTAGPAEIVPMAPEDLMYFMEHIDEADDGADTVPMSELIALASLAEDVSLADVIHGADSPIPASLSLPAEVSEIDETELEIERLSPAERVMMQATEVIPTAAEDEEDASDPAAYARQQLAQLGMSDDALVISEGDAESDPAAYARQQLAQLDMSGGAIGEMTPPPHATEQLDPRQQELVRKFRETEEQVRALRGMYQAGHISQDEFMMQLRNLMVLDDDHVWWMMGVETDTWYKSENNTWVPATPPVLLAQQRAQQGTGTSPSPATQHSLPYLPDDSQQPGTYGEYSPAPQDIRLDENYMPLPRQVPLHDPDFTVPNPRVIDAGDVLPSDAATVPGAAYFQPTVMAQPVEYGTIEAPYDETEPPDYELEYQGEVYRAAVEEQRQSLGRILTLVAVAGIVITFLTGAAFIAGALLWYQGIVDQWEPGIIALGAFEPEFQTVTILDSGGNRIATLARDGDDRRPVSLNQVSPYMIHAVISLENPRFFEDPGWDLFAILRAFWTNFVVGNIESGASTITQQVARALILQTADPTAERKLNEIIVAGEMTRRYTKSEILELYLNDVAFFGNQTYGVEAAAQFYFDKPAAELTWPEAALLASIIQSPATTEPVNNRETALNLMRITMDRMIEIGCVEFGHTGELFCVDQAERNSGRVARDMALVQARTYLPRQFAVRYPHFTQLVQAQLENIYGASEVYRAGFVVTTTLNSSIQDTAQQALIDRMAALSTNGVNTGSIMVTDPRNGAILAMVGSPDFNNAEIAGQVNAALTWQQPGSAIKPVLYTAALSGVDITGNGAIDRYFTPATILWDVPTAWGNYIPRNFDGQFRGPIALRAALQQSINLPAIKTLEIFGVDHFRRVAEAMGLTFRSDAEFNLTTAVGSTDVRLYDMMAAFGTLANNGRHARLYTIESIVDSNGNPIPLPERGEPAQTIRPQIAYLMQNILSDDTARTPQFGTNSPMTIPGLPTQNYVAAKTGTSDQGRDLWTMGFTNNRVVGVWLGTFDNAPTFNVQGSTAAAPVWNTVMRAALENNSPREFPPPGDGTIVNRQVCADTGTVPGEICTTIRNELFAANQPPPAPEEAFSRRLRIDSWTGLVANEFCPDQVIEATFANIEDAAAINWINTTAQGQAYAQRIGLTVPVIQAPQQACNQSTPIPVANIANPVGGQTVQGVVNITGQVSAENFHRYQLEFAPAGTQNFQPIGPVSTTQQPAAGSSLGTWDTTTIPNGEYTIRLAVFANNGGYLYRTVQLVVNNPPPTPTPVTPTPPPIPVVPTEPLPFDPIPLDPNAQFTPVAPVVPQVPTPTINPLGG